MSIEDAPNSAVVNPGNGINYSHIEVVLLAIVCLLFFVVFIVKFYIKLELVIPCLHRLYIMIEDLVM